MKRYRPVLNDRKEVIMSEDESGDWTSLSCYYTLHDRVARAEVKVAAIAAENERLRKAGDVVANLLGCMCLDDYYRLDDYYQEAVDAWDAAKEGRNAK